MQRGRGSEINCYDVPDLLRNINIRKGENFRLPLNFWFMIEKHGTVQ